MIIKKSITGDLAEILGLLCAEGSYRDYYSNYFEFDKRRNKHYYRKNHRQRIMEFNNKNPVLLNFFVDLLQKEFNNYISRIYISKGDVKRVSIKKTDIINCILCYTSIGCCKWKVPEAIINGDKNIQIRFIRGYFNGDGCIDKSKDGKVRFRFTSVNESGIKSVSEMLKTLEINNNLNGPYLRENRRPCFEILILRESNQTFINKILSHNIAGVKASNVLLAASLPG